MTEYLELEAVAELLGVDRDAVYRLVRTGQLPGVKLATGWRIKRTQALRYRATH